MSKLRLAARMALALVAGLMAVPGCGRSATWSPDSRAVLLEAEGKLRLFNLSSRTFQSVDTGDRYAFSPAFSPDGTQLAYYGISGSGKSAHCDIWVRHLGPSGQERVVAEGVLPVRGTPQETATNKGLLQIAWRPDGAQLAYSRVSEDRGQIETVDLVSGAVTRLGRSEQSQFMPAWSPDGEQLAFLAQGNSARDRGNSFGVYVAQPGSAEPAWRLDRDLDGEFWPAWPLTWSANGAEIAALRVRDGRAAVVVLNLEHGAERKLLGLESVDGSITADLSRVVHMGGPGDREVVFRAAPFSERRILDRIERSDKPLSPLEKPRFPLHPVLSGDGSTVALPLLDERRVLRLYDVRTGEKSTFRIP